MLLNRNMKPMMAEDGVPEGCTHDCSTCGADCGSREIEKLTANENSNIKKIFAVISGKGGVGKSLVTSLLASKMNKNGKNVAILDADITGPSIPQAFGLKGRMAESDETSIYPVLSKRGVKVISANLLMPDDSEPIVWKGPLISGLVQQLYTDVTFGDVDYMFVDMPPGTGDVPLTVFQMLPVDGVIVVTSPQDLVSMVVTKSIKMAQMMNIPIVGIVENMSYISCPDCGKKIKIYGNDNSRFEIEKTGVKVVAELPIDPNISKLVDAGEIEEYETDSLNELVSLLEKN